MFVPEFQLHFKKNMELLKTMADNSLDAVVTDCPYGFGKEPDALETLQAWITTGYHEITGAGFMGKKWDSFVPQPIFWKEVFRVLKPGGYVLAFFGTRTYDWGTMAIRLGGFEIRDCIQWIYGSGFPKSLDVSKAIDKQGPMGQAPFAEFAAHYEERRKAKGLTHAAVCEAGGFYGSVNHGGSSVNWSNGYGLPTTAQWEVLQPLLGLDASWLENVKREEYEREVIGQKETGNPVNWYANQDEEERGDGLVDITAPASEDAKTWAGYGTALKPANEPICVARKPLQGTVANNVLTHGCGALNLDGCRIGNEEITTMGGNKFKGGIYNTYDECEESNHFGRFPANVIFDEEAAAVLDQQTWDAGGASRFFKVVGSENYCSFCVTLREANNKDKCKTISAGNAETLLKTLKATTGNFVPLDVMQQVSEKSAQLVQNAGDLCEKCAINFVQEVAKISSNKDHQLQAIQDFINDSRKCTLLQSLAYYVETMANIDTTPTITSLLKLFGYALHAIENYTKQDTPEAEGQKLEPSRFLYNPKASKEDRNYGCEGLEAKDPACVTDFRPSLKSNPENWTNGTESAYMRTTKKKNNHPTVKPIALMRYLCRLVKTPLETFTIADFYMGSGTTGVACMLEGINFIGCDEDQESYNTSKARVSFAKNDYIKQQSQPKQVDLFAVAKPKAPVSIAQTLF